MDLKNLRVLYVEDEAQTCELMKELLQDEVGEIVLASDGYVALDVLNTQFIDVIVSDIEMPRMSGIELAKLVKSGYPHIPIILLSAYEDSKYLKAGYEVGVDRYMTKPIMDETILLKNIEEVCMHYDKQKNKENLLNALVEENEHLKRLSHEDTLTGLYNRRAIEDRLKESLSRALRQKNVLSIAIADIDDFKKINDTHGHLIGDKALCAFSYMLKESLRDIDTVGRWGGEEFIIIMPDTGYQEAIHVLERIRSKLAIFTEDDGIKLSASFGICTFDPQSLPYDDKDKECLLKKADIALYYAKSHGKNQVTHFESLPYDIKMMHDYK